MSQPESSSFRAHVARIVATCALLAPAGLLTTTSVPAQVGAHADGWFVAGTFQAPGWPVLGSSGMWLVHPRNPGDPIPVTGLPPTLVGSTDGGIWSMTRRASDGALFVADAQLGPALIHEIRLVGSAATFATHQVGATRGVTSCAALPDGTVLLGASRMSAGPMASMQLGILDPATGGVTALSLLTRMTGEVEAVAVDLTGTLVYVVLSQGASGPGALYEVPLPAGQQATQLATPTLRATFTNRPRSVAVDNEGRVVVATHWSGGGVFVWDPANPSMPPTLLPAVPSGGQLAVAIERATGNYVVSHGATSAAAWLPPTGGPLNLLTNGPMVGWGALRALVALDDPVAFGKQSTCVSGGDYAWRTAPNPGGLPLVGNSGFSITLQAPNPQPVCAFGLSLGAAPLPLPGLPSCALLLLDPTWLTATLVGPTGSDATFTLPLSVPNDAGLAGLSVFAQSFHLVAANPGIIESSPGLRMTIL